MQDESGAAPGVNRRAALVPSRQQRLRLALLDPAERADGVGVPEQPPAARRLLRPLRRGAAGGRVSARARRVPTSKKESGAFDRSREFAVQRAGGERAWPARRSQITTAASTPPLASHCRPASHATAATAPLCLPRPARAQPAGESDTSSSGSAFGNRAKAGVSRGS
jgi:hypothetical protein